MFDDFWIFYFMMGLISGLFLFIVIDVSVSEPPISPSVLDDACEGVVGPGWVYDSDRSSEEEKIVCVHKVLASSVRVVKVNG